LAGSPLLFFFVCVLYRILAGLVLIHSILHHQNWINPRSLSPIPKAMATKNLREFSAPTVENIRTGPALETNNLEFELKPSLINMVQATQFSGKVHEDASAHL
jgi:hypothetical protein